jgi:hypothetical protein
MLLAFANNDASRMMPADESKYDWCTHRPSVQKYFYGTRAIQRRLHRRAWCDMMGVTRVLMVVDRNVRPVALIQWKI